ncbi:MAG: TonB-dependent receptor, partial [Gemmatimonadales bacterium]|nr:TonB-dependent receptor [Gemmatimonadales bacterium]
YRTRQYEVGIKQEWGRFGGSLSLFQITQRSGMVNPANNRYEDAGEQRHRGVELNAFGELAKGVRLIGGAAWVDAKLINNASIATIGKRPAGVPEFTLNLAGEWDVPGAPGLTLTGGLIHTGSSYVDANNTARLPSWTRTDLGVRWTTRVTGQRVTFRASLENAFDERYWASVSYGNLALGMPRTFALSATVDF